VYVHGQFVGAGALHFQLADLNDLNNWLGRSQLGPDAYFVGSYNECQIYRGAMTAGDGALSFASGPNAPHSVPEVRLSIQDMSNGTAPIAWPAGLTAYTPEAADHVGSVFAPVIGLVETSEGEEMVVYNPLLSLHRVHRLRLDE
jgi:hypothetical protein